MGSINERMDKIKEAAGMPLTEYKQDLEDRS